MLRNPIKNAKLEALCILRRPGADPCRPVHATSVAMRSYELRALLSRCPLLTLGLTLFLPPLLWGSLSSEKRDLMETSHLGQSVSKVSHSVYNV